LAGRCLLETDRLLLREFDEADALAYYSLGSDPLITRYTGAPPLTSLEQALEVLRSNPLADYQRRGFGRWACVLRQSGAVIGFAGLKWLDELQEVDLGYRLLPAYWGRGLATEASQAALNYGLRHLKLQRVIGLVDPANLASVRVLEKLGMTRTGMLEYRGDQVLQYATEAGAPGKGVVPFDSHEGLT
jgi:[ribosomal protein S5]-alanine N-acetyltransferase